MSDVTEVVATRPTCLSVKCECMAVPFGPNPSCVHCGGDGTYVEEEVIGFQVICEATLNAGGIIYDPTGFGRPRWTHKASGRAVVRQPFMSDVQWRQAVQAFYIFAKDSH